MSVMTGVLIRDVKNAVSPWATENIKFIQGGLPYMPRSPVMAVMPSSPEYMAFCTEFENMTSYSDSLMTRDADNFCTSSTSIFELMAICVSWTMGISSMSDFDVHDVTNKTNTITLIVFMNIQRSRSSPSRMRGSKIALSKMRNKYAANQQRGRAVNTVIQINVVFVVMDTLGTIISTNARTNPAVRTLGVKSANLKQMFDILDARNKMYNLDIDDVNDPIHIAHTESEETRFEITKISDTTVVFMMGFDGAYIGEQNRKARLLCVGSKTSITIHGISPSVLDDLVLYLGEKYNDVVYFGGDWDDTGFDFHQDYDLATDPNSGRQDGEQLVLLDDEEYWNENNPHDDEPLVDDDEDLEDKDYDFDMDDENQLNSVDKMDHEYEHTY